MCNNKAFQRLFHRNNQSSCWYLFTRLSQHSLGHVTGSRHSSSVSVSLIISVTAESDSDPTWKMSENKREIPSGLKKILDADVKISKDFVEFVNNKYPSNALRAHLKSLEISCHGIPWYKIKLLCQKVKIQL